MTEQREVAIGRMAWWAAWVGLVVGQLHALARFRTADGREDIEEYPWTAAWAVPADDALAPLLGWADPDLVYVTYGKIWLPVFAAATMCAFVVYRRRQPAGYERWAWRFYLAGSMAVCVSVLLGYWTQWTGNYAGEGIEATLFDVGWMVTLPSLLLHILSATVLGVVLLVRRFRPRLSAALLAAILPLGLLITEVTSLGSLLLPSVFAFAILGRRIARADHLTPAAGRPASDRHASQARL